MQLEITGDPPLQFRIHRFLRRVNLRDPEISDLQPPIRANQNILRLQVPMDHMPRVQILQSAQYIAEKRHNRAPRKTTLGVHILQETTDQRMQIAGGRVLHHNVHVVRHLEERLALHDARMLQIAQQIDLARHRVPMFAPMFVVMELDAFDAAPLVAGIVAEIHGAGREEMEKT